MRSASWDLPKRYSTLGFLFPENRGPQFGNNRMAVAGTVAATCGGKRLLGLVSQMPCRDSSASRKH